MNQAIRSEAFSKVPEITLLFWIIKILTTGVGETTSDFLAHRYDPVIVVAISFLVLCTCLALQLFVRRYMPLVYWLAIVLVSIFGTMAADVLHVGLGIPYTVSTSFFLLSLALIFAVWYLSERTLSIHSIFSPRRELFYWAAILTTFALGTAAGDLAATTFGLGYLGGGLFFLLVFALPGLAYRFGLLGEIMAFWLAYIFTRPLGASFADWAGVTPDRGGLDLGTGPVSLVLGAIIALLVGLSAWRHRSKPAMRRDGAAWDPAG